MVWRPGYSSVEGTEERAGAPRIPTTEKRASPAVDRRACADTNCPFVVAGRAVARVQGLPQTGVQGRVISIDEPQALDHALGDVCVLWTPPVRSRNGAAPDRIGRGQEPIISTSPVSFRRFGTRLANEAARKRGIMIMPGVGLGVAASDCLAMHVASRVLDAKNPRIALLRPDLLSRGTLRSALGLANSRVHIRRNARLMSVPVGRLQRVFDFGDGARESVAVSWPDVFTAYHSTGVRNIEAYFEADVTARALYQLGAGIADIVRSEPVRRLLGIAANAWPEGPSAPRRRAQKCVIVAEVEDSWRRRRSARLKRLTATALPPKRPSRSRSVSRLATSVPASRLRQKSTAPISCSDLTACAARN